MNFLLRKTAGRKKQLEDSWSLRLPSGRDQEVRVIRSSARQTTVIQIKGGAVVVRAPLAAKDRTIEGFLDQKSAWIEKTLSNERHKAPPQTTLFHEGASFLFLGQSHHLRFREGRPMRAEFTAGALQVWLPADPDTRRQGQRARRLIEAHYRMLALDHFTRKSRHAAQTLGTFPRSVRVRDTKSRWGSCSAEGGLSFCWRVIMAPESVVDYLVAHEVAHLVEMNHSKAFWKHVERLCPDYKSRRRWLKEHGHTLTFNP